MLLRLPISLAFILFDNAIGKVDKRFFFFFYCLQPKHTKSNHCHIFQVYPKYMCHFWRRIIRGIGLAFKQHCEQGMLCCVVDILSFNLILLDLHLCMSFSYFRRRRLKAWSRSLELVVGHLVSRYRVLC